MITLLRGQPPGPSVVLSSAATGGTYTLYSMSGFLYSLHIHYTTQYSFNSWDIVVTFIFLKQKCVVIY